MNLTEEPVLVEKEEEEVKQVTNMYLGRNDILRMKKSDKFYSEKLVRFQQLSPTTLDHFHGNLVGSLVKEGDFSAPLSEIDEPILLDTSLSDEEILSKLGAPKTRPPVKEKDIAKPTISPLYVKNDIVFMKKSAHSYSETYVRFLGYTICGQFMGRTLTDRTERLMQIEQISHTIMCSAYLSLSDEEALAVFVKRPISQKQDAKPEVGDVVLIPDRDANPYLAEITEILPENKLNLHFLGFSFLMDEVQEIKTIIRRFPKSLFNGKKSEMLKMAAVIAIYLKEDKDTELPFRARILAVRELENAVNDCLQDCSIRISEMNCDFSESTLDFEIHNALPALDKLKDADEKTWKQLCQDIFKALCEDSSKIGRMTSGARDGVLHSMLSMRAEDRSLFLAQLFDME